MATQSFMEVISQDVWFFAHNGEKGGPVDFSTLQQMAKEGKLHPRLDLIWAKGMDRWQPAGEIRGLFERRPAVVSPVIAGTAAVTSEKATTVVPRAKATLGPDLPSDGPTGYGPTGAAVVMPGARRRSYLFFLLVFPVLWFALVCLARTFIDVRLGQETLALIGSGLLVLPALVVLVFTIMRLVNLGMSGWWFLGNFVPILNLWVGYRCFACPPGYAIYKKMDRAGIVLAILYWLLMLAGIVAFGALVAIVFGHMGPPDLREQIIDAIREATNMPAKP